MNSMITQIPREIRKAAVRGRFGTFWVLIQTELPSGASQLLGSYCHPNSAKKLQDTLQNTKQEKQYVYSIDETPVNEPNRRCDGCTCRT
jgi:hypothetical protein